MGNTDSTQRLGEKVRSAKAKLETDLAMQSEKYEYLLNNSPNTLDVMMKSVMDSFESCSPFREPTLLIAWKHSPKTCQKIVLESCEKVLRAPIQKSEYDWFKSYVFPSSVWMFKSAENNNRFMYEELLDIGKHMSHGIIDSMDSIYSHLESHPKWAQMMDISNKAPISRQDHASVGLLKEVGLKDIFEYETKNEDEKAEEMKTFIDSNVAVNILTTAAANINNEFQNHMNRVMSKFGTFKAGPTKKVERCVSKLENDYANAQYPKAAKLLDLIRCSVTFNTVEQLIVGYHGLIKHISQNESIIQVSRVKNGFLDPQKGGYRDLKVNIVYKSQINPGNNMVCEVQLMLINYLEEKKRIHKLYSILREELYFEMIVKNEQVDTAKNSLKFVPELSVGQEIKTNNGDCDMYKCSVDTDTELVAMEGNGGYFGIVHLKEKKDIHEIKRNFNKHIHGWHGRQSHKWVTINNNQKYVSVQTSMNEIKMFKIEKNNNDSLYELTEDENFRITLANRDKINYCDFDTNFESIFLIINDSTLQKRSMQNVNDIIVGIELEEKIEQSSYRNFSLSNDGNFCGLGGGKWKDYFFVIDIVAQKQYKMKSNTLDSTYVPCFINGQNEYIVVGDRQGRIEIWDIPNKKAIKMISNGINRYITSSASANNILAIGSDGKKVLLYNVTNWECFYSYDCDLHPRSLHLTNDLKYITVGGNGKDKCLVFSIQ